MSNSEEREREAGRRTVVRRGVREVDRVKDWEWEWEWAPGRRWGEREDFLLVGQETRDMRRGQPERKGEELNT